MRQNKSTTLWISLGAFVLALLVRLPHLSQSLWLDEMTTLVDYVEAPWQKVIAAHTGEYVPNNHVLHTIAVKVIYSIARESTAQSSEPNESLLRLPSLIAGCLLPIALAWPLRRTVPWIALLVALLTAMHPWFIAFSTEARGYSMMILLCVIATNLLPDGRRRWPIGYAVAMAAAIYTVPIAVLLLLAHAATMQLASNAPRESRAVPPRSGPTRSGSAFLPTDPAWLRGAALALILSSLLYLPMARATLQYYRRPYQPTITFREFLDQLPRFALAGERVPPHDDPLLRAVDPPAASVYWALPILTIVVGSVFAWSIEPLRPMLVTFGLTSVCAVLMALASPAACEVRFAPWAGLWFIVAVAAILASPPQRWAKRVAIMATVMLIGWMGLRDALMLPNQPVREALRRADELAPPDRAILIGYLGARESAYLYGNEVTRHDLTVGHDMPRFLAAEQRVVDATGRKPWVVISYEDLARRRNRATEEDARGLWTHLMKNYQLVARLPGRVSPVAIYAPRDTVNVTLNLK